MTNTGTSELYEQRVSALESLDYHSKVYEKYKKRERAWRTARLGVWIAPFITAATLVSPGVKEKIDISYKLGIELASILASFTGFVMSDISRQNAFKNMRETDLSAVPIIEGFVLPTPLRLEQSLLPDTDINPYEPTENA